VAVLLVVLYHAGLSWLPGGYVGVDVFFVISGYVITGVLLRERASAGTTSLLGFYARRVRRILPAATLVLITTVIAALFLLGAPFAVQTAVDAKWAAVFLANFHFANVGTNYLSAQLPPSPLQNFWTLAVEEQFYLVFPTVFLAIAGLRSRYSMRIRLLAALGALSLASLLLSVVQTNSSPGTAYFSPFTRAWELALGAIVALSAPALVKIPGTVAALASWAGLAAVIAAGLVFNTNTVYPGIAVALPVIGAAAIIAAGTAAPTLGSERLLATLPFRQLGRISYSLYLWHWPILLLAAESAGRSSLSFSANLWWLLVALLASIITFRLVENPVRHSQWLRWRAGASIAMGAVLVGATLGVSTIAISVANPASSSLTTSATAPTGTLSQVERLVAAAPAIRSVPANLTPSLGNLNVGDPLPHECDPVDYGVTTMKPCLFGDPNGERAMVLYGDSHSGMWFQTLDDIATAEHWKLWFLAKSACPVELLPIVEPGGFGPRNGEFTQCAQWHANAIADINQLRPDLVIVSQEIYAAPGSNPYNSAQWRLGLERFFDSITDPGVQFAVIGNIPHPHNDPPVCLQANPHNVPACSQSRAKSLDPYAGAEEDAVASVGGHYIDVVPWFCSAVCTGVIGKYQVYFNQAHVMGSYATSLGGVMAEALHLPPSVDTSTPTTVKMLAPIPRAVVKGTAILAAAANGSSVNASTYVEFVLSGEGIRNHVIASAKRSITGWAASWDTSTVRNGSYDITASTRSAHGDVVKSAAVRIHVKN
jgi:peptidoglycan/LPS O-acetylase OafA/YrhL